MGISLLCGIRVLNISCSVSGNFFELGDWRAWCLSLPSFLEREGQGRREGGREEGIEQESERGKKEASKRRENKTCQPF